MGFKSHLNENTKESIQVEIKVLENSINDEMPKGDRVVIENRIKKLQREILAVEDTVSADIANVETNLMAPCTGKSGCGCQKCKLLRREKPALTVNEAMSFGNFFGQ